MKRVLTIAAVAALGLTVMAQGAQAKSHHKPREPKQSASFARDTSWELAQDWTATQESDSAESTDVSIHCSRVRRSVVDCLTRVTFTETDDDGGDRDYHASWKLRFRAGGRLHDHTDYYFVGDRWASLDPEDEKFGGLALHTDYTLETSSSDEDDPNYDGYAD